MNQTLREEKSNRLIRFYQENNISCDNFNCNHSAECSSLANGRPLTRGAEAHLGTKYGEIAKILVLSLDTGGGSENIEDRTFTIESVTHEIANPHMKGTVDILLDLFQAYKLDSIEVLKHFAMTNAEKCSATDDSSDKLPTQIYTICRPYHLEEIKILDPDVVYAEGVDSLPHGLTVKEDDLKEIEDFCQQLTTSSILVKSIKNILKKYVYRLFFGEKPAYLIKCPHPSARNGQWQLFRDISLPIFNLYVRHKINMPNDAGQRHGYL